MPFQGDVLFLYPLETSEYLWVHKCNFGLKWVNGIDVVNEFFLNLKVNFYSKHIFKKKNRPAFTCSNAPTEAPKQNVKTV